jgi:hypothetical protein
MKTRLMMKERKSYIMKGSTKNNNAYAEAKAKWAKAQTELFLNILEQTGTKLGVIITPLQYVKAYKICIEDYKFAYPAEYKIAELIATEES